MNNCGGDTFIVYIYTHVGRKRERVKDFVGRNNCFPHDNSTIYSRVSAIVHVRFFRHKHCGRNIPRQTLNIYTHTRSYTYKYTHTHTQHMHFIHDHEVRRDRKSQHPTSTRGRRDIVAHFCVCVCFLCVKLCRFLCLQPHTYTCTQSVAEGCQMVKTGTGYKTFLYAPSGRRRGRFRPAVRLARARYNVYILWETYFYMDFRCCPCPSSLTLSFLLQFLNFFPAFLLVLTLPEILPPAGDVSL